MNKILTLTLSAAAAILPLCAEAAEFEIPDPFTLVMVDSDDRDPAVKSGATTVTLPAGPHQLVMRVEGTFRYHTDSRYLAGQPVVVNFNAEENDRLTLSFRFPKSFDKIERFAYKPDVKLVHADGTPKEGEIFVLNSRNGVQIGRDFQKELEDAGKAFKVHTPEETSKATVKMIQSDSSAAPVAAAGTAAVAAPATSAAAAAPKSAPSVSAKGAMETLQKAYLSLSPEDRKNFLHWVISQQ